MAAIETFRASSPVAFLCHGLDVSRASAYRFWRKGTLPKEQKEREKPLSPRALSDGEKREVVEALHSERFQDSAPAEIAATLLDEGRYLCSVSTMYRILREKAEVKERRRRVNRRDYPKPQLLATGPNQVWSWDITKLLGPAKWTYFYLYVLLDIFSRYVVGWTISERQSGALAKVLIEETLKKQHVTPENLTIHSDRGGPMIAKPLVFLLADLGITKSLSRPHVSDDNPFSESQFSTLKGFSLFPGRFGCLQDAWQYCQTFFPWYNGEHKHSGIGYYTPQSVHYGRAEEFYALRRQTLLDAYKAHPERFVNKIPKPKAVPEKVWINPPLQIGGTETLGPIQKVDCEPNTAIIFGEDFPKGGEIRRSDVDSSSSDSTIINSSRLSHFC